MKDNSMFYGAPPVIFGKAKTLRQTMTLAEKVLWMRINKKQLKGYRFRRQHPISNFIVDFYCHEAKLIIEVDGSVHDVEEQKEYDMGREFELSQLGLRVIRFSNEEVINFTDGVVRKIEEMLG